MATMTTTEISNFINILYKTMKLEGKTIGEQEMINILKSVLYLLRSEMRLSTQADMGDCVNVFFNLYREDHPQASSLDSRDVIKYGIINETWGNIYIRKVDEKIAIEKREAERKLQEKKEAAERARLERNRKRMEQEAQIRASSINKNIDNECTKNGLTIYFTITILLLLLGFAVRFLFGFAMIWAFVGGIGMIIKCHLDVEKKKQEWINNHPEDIAGRYL